jgi:hypothetical protein
MRLTEQVDNSFGRRCGYSNQFRTRHFIRAHRARSPATASRVGTPDELAAEGKSQPSVKVYRSCPVCGQFSLTDPEGNISAHFSAFSSCPGSGEPTDLSSGASPKDEEQPVGVSESVVDLAKAMVKVLQPGWRWRAKPSSSSV